jgi:hypothetical protein
MDRLKLETAYRRALDVLMSAVDERQLQGAIFRLHRAQARLHGWGMPGSHDPERRGYLGARAGRPSPALRHLPQATGFKADGARSPTDNRAIERRVRITVEELLSTGEH